MQKLTAFLKQENNPLFLFLLIFLATACNQPTGKAKDGSDSSSNDRRGASTDSGGNTLSAGSGRGLNATLHDLYMTKAEFQQVMADPNSAQYRKFVFNFLFPEGPLEGSPTLALWPRRMGRDFSTQPAQLLHYARASNVSVPANLYLGDLQTAIPPLQTAINRPDCQDKCVLYFAADGQNYMGYKVFLIPDSTIITRKATGILDLHTLSEIGMLNPSPPHSAD